MKLCEKREALPTVAVALALLLLWVLPGAPRAEDRSLGEPVESRDLPGGEPAESPPEGVEPRPAPVDPVPARPAPARGDLLPEPMDEPIPPNAGQDRAFWEARHARAQGNLERIRGELGETEDQFTRACRYKGGDRCDDLRARAEALRRQVVALESYLAGGLREACRKAGCLPGWIRD